MKTGDVVEITGVYFKNDNGLFRIEHSPPIQRIEGFAVHPKTKRRG